MLTIHIERRELFFANLVRRIEHLQSWISQNSFVDTPNQILMTARGKQVKLQTLQAEVRLST